MIKSSLKKTSSNDSPLEIEEQSNFVDYLEKLKFQGNDILYSATAQSTYTRSWAQLRNNKKLGVTSGLPDLIIIINKTLVFVEMKRTKGGTIDISQKQWQQKLTEAGVYAYICKGFHEAVAVINQFKK